MGQKVNDERTLNRFGNELYIVYNNSKYKVDESRIIAKLKPQRKLLKAIGEKTHNLGFDILEIPVPEGIKVEDFLMSLYHTEDFDFLDYCTYGNYYFTPNDELLGNQESNQWYLEKIHAYNAWDITTGNSSTKVAILDSGVDSCHQDIHYGSDNYTHMDILSGFNYPENTHYSAPIYFHGTMVAGIIGAKANNSIGIAGLSGGNHFAGVSIIPFNVGNSQPNTSYVINAIYKAVENGAKIINMSFGFPYNEGVACAINAAYNQGTTIICATGNSNSSSIDFPASHHYTIAVGATNQSNLKADFSNYGNGIDLVAPGVDIISTSLNNSYATASGTSFSTPQVAGAAALMISVNPDLTPYQIRTILRNTCTKISGYSYNNGWNNKVGYGLLNVFAAVVAAMDLKIVGPQIVSTSETYYVDNLPSGVTVEWSLSDSYYNQNRLQQDYPSQNQCTITRSGSYDMMDATLTATVKYNGVTVQTLTKSGLYAFAGFKGTYSSSFGSGQYTAPNPIFTASNSLVTVTSPKLTGATLTYSGDITPTYKLFFDNRIEVAIPSSGGSYIINVECQNGETYTIPIIRSSHPLAMNVSLNEEMLTVAMDGAVTDKQYWSLEIYNATTGEKNITKKVSGKSASLNTSGWKSGLYAVRVTVGREVLTEKIQIKGH